MSKTPREVLEDCRQWFSVKGRWCQGHSGLDKNGEAVMVSFANGSEVCRLCMDGALFRFSGSLPLSTSAPRYLYYDCLDLMKDHIIGVQIRDESYTSAYPSLSHINDAEGTTQDDVLEWFTGALADLPVEGEA